MNKWQVKGICSSDLQYLNCDSSISTITTLISVLTTAPPTNPPTPWLYDLIFSFHVGAQLRIMAPYFQRSPLAGSHLCHICHLSLPWKQCLNDDSLHFTTQPQNEKWHQPHSRGVSSHLSSFQLHVSSQMELNYVAKIFSAVGWGGGGSESTRTEKNIFEMYLTQW